MIRGEGLDLVKVLRHLAPFSDLPIESNENLYLVTALYTGFGRRFGVSGRSYP